jgi:hypothetical protein
MSTVEVRDDVDLWDLWNAGRWAVIPTNTQRRGDGTAVMGAGLARDAADRFAGLDRRYGDAIAVGRHRLAVRDHRLLLAPTKHHWREPATLALVADTAEHCARYARTHGLALVVPALGAGLGGLAWADVEAVLVAAFDGTDTVLIAPR